MKIIRNLLILGFFTANFVHAQTISTAQTSAADLGTMLQAVEQMTPVSADSLPRFGNYYSALHAPGTRFAWPPLPGNPRQLDVWDLGEGFYLVNDLRVDYSTPLIQSGISSKTKISAMTSGMTVTAKDVPSFDGGGGGD